MLRLESRRALLEQGLKCGLLESKESKGFTKILLINKSFVFAPRHHNVYRFAMEMELYKDKICVLFGNHKEGRTRRIQMFYPLACRLFSLLNPKFFAGYIGWDDDIGSIVNQLMSSDCRIALDFWHFRLPPIGPLSQIWTRVVEVRLDVGHLSGLGILPQHHFNKLHVCSVGTVNQLMICLRQNTEELKIDYSFGVLNIVRDLEQRRIEVNRDVKSLKVCGWIDRVSDILTIMRAVFPALPNLSTVEIDPGRRWKRIITLGKCVRDVAVDDFKSFKELTALVGGGKVEPIRVCCDYEINEDPDEFIVRLKKAEPAFNDAVIKDDHRFKEACLKSKTDRIESEFVLRLWFGGNEIEGNLDG